MRAEWGWGSLCRNLEGEYGRSPGNCQYISLRGAEYYCERIEECNRQWIKLKLERQTNCPPESGGQHDRNVVEIMRGVVPITKCFRLGTTPRGIRFAIPLPS